MKVNISEIVAEVAEAFMAYEKAPLVDGIDELFWNDARMLRYGPNGTLVGYAALSAFRRGPWTRTLRDIRIVTFGRDFAVANTESTRPGTAAVSRQSWTPDGWRIVAAHVSDQP